MMEKFTDQEAIDYALDELDSIWDEGPQYEGWTSDKLSKGKWLIRERLAERDSLAEQKNPDPGADWHGAYKEMAKACESAVNQRDSLAKQLNEPVQLSEWQKLKAENERLAAENEELRAQNFKYLNTFDDRGLKVEKLSAELAELKKERKILSRVIFEERGLTIEDVLSNSKESTGEGS